MRPLCKACNQRPAAINYQRNEVTHYRQRCGHCISRGRKQKPAVTRWQSAGYKKKDRCDRCGFRSKYASQLIVCHIDGRLHNTELSNLRTVCLNCVEEIKRLPNPWTVSDLQADR